jgi:hypothetical protein
MTSTESMSGPIKIALTVDDLFQWKGAPELNGYPYQTIARRLTDAFDSHGVRGVYAFSNTAPVDDHRALSQVFTGGPRLVTTSATTPTTTPASTGWLQRTTSLTSRKRKL